MRPAEFIYFIPEFFSGRKRVHWQHFSGSDNSVAARATNVSGEPLGTNRDTWVLQQ